MTDEQAAQLWGGLKRLRDLDRQTLVAFYFEGQSLIEMSDTDLARLFSYSQPSDTSPEADYTA